MQKNYVKKLSEPKRKLFTHDYQAVLEGKHPLKMGTIFDVEKDLILTQDHGMSNLCLYMGRGATRARNRRKTLSFYFKF
jgi:hypothetical protein